MTWREILEGLASLPTALKHLHQLQRTASVQIAHIAPGDAIVIETEARLSRESRDRIYEGVKSIWPDVKVIVLDSGFQMRIVSPSTDEGNHVH